jgi:hypothetical protein
MQLFICHASEDKPDFVRPLAEALRSDFHVWYDEYELNVGDSIRQKIDQGLASSDYAIVVLSPSFFQKKWPQAELDGLFSLEDKSRKLILPIWKDIDEAGVKGFSPTLSGRHAARAADGVPAVVAQLKQAIAASQRTREISHAEILATRFRTLDSSIAARGKAEQLMRSGDGARLVTEEFEKIATALNKWVSATNLQTMKFEFGQGVQPGMPTVFVIGASLRLGMELTGMAINGAIHAVLTCDFHEIGRRRDFGEPDRPRKLEEVSYYPWFGVSGEAVWRKSKTGDEFITSEQLIELSLGKFHDFIERKAKGQL